MHWRKAISCTARGFLMSLVPSEIDLAADIAAGKGITLVELARQHREGIT